jgi:hypothetical protein
MTGVATPAAAARRVAPAARETGPGCPGRRPQAGCAAAGCPVALRVLRWLDAMEAPRG